MRLILIIDGKEWVEVPVRGFDQVKWQAAQIKREYAQWITESKEWSIVLHLKHNCK